MPARLAVTLALSVVPLGGIEAASLSTSSSSSTGCADGVHARTACMRVRRVHAREARACA
eukprot:3036069-Prymnesium_polylepis.1